MIRKLSSNQPCLFVKSWQQKVQRPFIEKTVTKTMIRFDNFENYILHVLSKKAQVVLHGQ